METYDIFDGSDWIAETLTTESRRWTIVSTNNRPWLDISGASRALGLSVGSEAHAVKVVNLRSNVIPVSLTLRGVHIDKVDQIALRIPQLVLASEAANESEKRTTVRSCLTSSAGFLSWPPIAS